MKVQLRCSRCGNGFLRDHWEVNRRKSKLVFCSRACQMAWQKENRSFNYKGGMQLFICDACGKQFARYASTYRGNERKLCSKNCSVDRRVEHPEGYVYLYMPDHPYCTKTGYILEHRHLIEKRIGRYLTPEEVVHHINGIKNDNRDANLLLFATNSDHHRHHGATRNSVAASSSTF